MRHRIKQVSDLGIFEFYRLPSWRIRILSREEGGHRRKADGTSRRVQ